ncbi:MAG: helix-turn-helix domain-containing protein [Bacteroidales bacterium]
MEMRQPELGKKISELRLAKGLTQNELAEKCKISLRTIQRIESFSVTPRSYTIKTIFLSLDFEYLDSFNEITNKPENLVSTYWLKLGQFYKYVSELFNLKTNTMKKVTIISLTIVFVSLGLLSLRNESKAQSINNWFKAGNKPNSYEIGFDKTVFLTGKKSAYLESKDKKIDGFGTLMQTCDAKDFLGKRVKMTAYVKSENITSWSGMWLRVDSRMEKKSLSFDNMQDRPIKGTVNWTKCEIVLDVPLESGTLNYGFLISGCGKIWIDKVSFEIVDKLEVKPTQSQTIPEKPTNIDFED